jgi:DNA replication protein DnaC
LLEREQGRRAKAEGRALPGGEVPGVLDFTARPSVNKSLVAELARAEFIDRRENVLFVGNPGTGKSHLAIAPSAAACAKGYRVRFFRVTELVTLLIADLFRPAPAVLFDRRSHSADPNWPSQKEIVSATST